MVAETGAMFIPPFDDYRIIAGQATAAKELMEEIEDLDYIITPVGGGGLAAGTALSADCLDPNIQVILAEPKNVDDTYRSFYSGERQSVITPETVADGLRVSVGERNFEIIKALVKEVITVEEDEIINAMRIIWERMKIIIEPSCAVTLAVVLKNKEKFAGKRIGLILTGGNVDLTSLPVLTRRFEKNLHFSQPHIWKVRFLENFSCFGKSFEISRYSIHRMRNHRKEKRLGYR